MTRGAVTASRARRTAREARRVRTRAPVIAAVAAALVATAAIGVIAPRPATADEKRSRAPAKPKAQPRDPARPAPEPKPEPANRAASHRARIAIPRAVRASDPRDLVRAQIPATLEDKLIEELAGLWSSRTLRRGTTAIYVVDADTGRPVYAVHENEPLNPASNVKLVATATALDILGPEFRYTTRVLGRTPDADGVIAGDIYLLGTGDPLLVARHLRIMAKKLAAAGVTRVSGRVLVGPDRLRDSLRRARFTLTVRGGRDGDPAAVSVSPANTMLDLEADVTTDRRTRLSIDTIAVDDPVLGRRYRLAVSGTIRPGRTWRSKRYLPERTVWAAHVLIGALERLGVAVAGGVAIEPLADYTRRAARGSLSTDGWLPVELTRHESMPLHELIAMINKRSINYLADRVVMTAGAARFGGPATMAKAVRAMHGWLERRAHLDADRVVLDTGSGLSYRTELSARQIVAVLRTAGGIGEDAEPSQVERAFLDSLAVAGVDGTLRSRFRRSAARGTVIGKTGTLSSVIALSGLIDEGEGRRLAFSIVTNGTSRRLRRRVRRQHEHIVEALHDYLRARPARSFASAAR